MRTAPLWLERLYLLLTLMLLVTFNDLGSFGLWRGLSGLIG